MKRLALHILILFLIQFSLIANQLKDLDYVKIMAMSISQLIHNEHHLKIDIVANSQKRAKEFQKLFEKIAKIRSGRKTISYSMQWQKNPNKSTANVILQLDSDTKLPAHIFSISTSKEMVENGSSLGIILKKTRPTIVGNRDSLLSSKAHFDPTFLRFIDILKRRKQ
ncbi:hypothetical protein MJH12_18715 [bacterium]|nr:hypothetical protein [bacterium]